MFSISWILAASILLQSGTAPADSAQPPVVKPLTDQDRADIFMARKMYREAIDLYKTLPPSAIVYNKIGIGYHQLLDLGNAAKYYQRAAKADPQYADAINNLGTIYYSKKSFRKAINEYKKAIRLKPDSASLLANLANAYFERKQYELASETIQQALAIDPNVFDNRGSSGSVVQDRSVGDRAKYHYYLAKTYAKKGQNSEALLYIRKCLEEGFKDKKKFNEEPEFAGLRDDPEFQQIMTMELKAL
ncbi:MAG: tetratricopeptide repeat protein [Bryobacteraceae bacterium]